MWAKGRPSLCHDRIAVVFLVAGLVALITGKVYSNKRDEARAAAGGINFVAGLMNDNVLHHSNNMPSLNAMGERMFDALKAESERCARNSTVCYWLAPILGVGAGLFGLIHSRQS